MLACRRARRPPEGVCLCTPRSTFDNVTSDPPAETCPRCVGLLAPPSEPDGSGPGRALSRTDERDPHAYVCQWCGDDESLAAGIGGGLEPQSSWPLACECGAALADF